MEYLQCIGQVYHALIAKVPNVSVSVESTKHHMHSLSQEGSKKPDVCIVNNDIFHTCSNSGNSPAGQAENITDKPFSDITQNSASDGARTMTAERESWHFTVSTPGGFLQHKMFEKFRNEVLESYFGCLYHVPQVDTSLLYL